MVAAVAAALEMVRGVVEVSPALLGFALISPAHPFSPILAAQRMTVARRLRNLVVLPVAGRFAVNIILPPN